MQVIAQNPRFEVSPLRFSSRRILPHHTIIPPNNWQLRIGSFAIDFKDKLSLYTDRAMTKMALVHVSDIQDDAPIEATCMALVPFLRMDHLNPELEFCRLPNDTNDKDFGFQLAKKNDGYPYLFGRHVRGRRVKMLLLCLSIKDSMNGILAHQVIDAELKKFKLIEPTAK